MQFGKVGRLSDENCCVNVIGGSQLTENKQIMKKCCQKSSCGVITHHDAYLHVD